MVIPMPHRVLVTKELAELLGVLSHPHRIRIVEELRDGERDVNSLKVALGINHSGVSQHLMVLRASRLVSERREGRHVFYQLRQPDMAGWLMEATLSKVMNCARRSARSARPGPETRSRSETKYVKPETGSRSCRS